MAFAHGGDVRAYGQVLDFSANLNPLGMPPAVAEAAAAAVAEAVHYPDPYCRAVRAALSVREGVPREQIVCGNGAADLIFRLCLALRPKRALLCAPTFSEYEQALSLCGCGVEFFTLSPERNFDLDESYLDRLTPQVDLAFLCTPNNPTGRQPAQELLERIVRRCRETGTVLVLDECFLELSDDIRGCAHLLAENPNLVLLRAFTKSYAMPGLRFGYALCSGEELVEKLHACGQPWSVSCVAQAAALAACGCPEWPQKGRALIRIQRPKLISALGELGLQVWAGQANYILFRAPGRYALREEMVEKGVLIRSCANYRGLGEDTYRIAVRSEAENQICLQVLREVLKNG